MSRALRHFLFLIVVFQLSQCQDLQIQCPQGWSLLYGRCYLSIPGRTLPFSQALSFCQKYGAKLVEPIGFVLTDEIGALVSTSDPSVTSVWTGYTREGYSPANDDTGAFWSDGSSATVDVGVWGHQEPNINMGSCAYMQREARGWMWYLGVCDQPRAFVCEATPCPAGSFRCDSGRCVATNLRCNGENNCGDNSDERSCPSECSVYITDLQQDLVYPGTNVGSYGNDETCLWVVEGAVGGRIYLQITQLNTEKGVDFVEIWGGGRTLSSSVLLRRVSGTFQDALAEAPVIVSPNNMAIVRFTSDSSVTNSGFRMQWRSEFECELVKTSHFSAVANDGNPTSPAASSENGCYNLCLQDASCVAATYNTNAGTCSRMSEMPRVQDAQADQVFYVKTCPGLRGNVALSHLPVVTSPLYATSTPAQLYSPLYPVFYPGGQSYLWTIYSSGQNLITVEILDIELGSRDYLRFYDGPDLRSNVIATLTSADVAPGRSITSTKNSMLVYFRSETYANAKGFLLTYRQGCDYTLTGSSGTIQSPGFDLNTYPNAMECTWTISTEQGRSLRLNFDTFSLEQGKDFLQIYKDNSAISVHSGSGYTGFSLPPVIDSADGRLRLTMTTSAVSGSQGFRATYNAGCLPISGASISMAPSSTVFRGDRVTVTCTNNYVFASPYTGQGSVVLTCGAGGDWDREVPTCTQVLCGNVPRISNGYLQSVTGVFSGDTATYVCDQNFRLYPDNTTPTCTNTGQWQPYPFCLSQTQCRPLLAPTHGQLDIVLGNGRDSGSVVQFICSTNGYELVGTPIISCVGGTWSADEPTCERIRCGLPYIANATLSPTDNIGLGDTISVTCRPGFQLFGASQFQCGVSTNLPTCQNIDECTNFQSRCSHICTDLPGGYTCSCREGFSLNADGFACDDINECATDNGDCDDVCTNTVGSYFCSCPSSTAELYTRSGQFGVFLPVTEDGTEPWNLYHINHTCLEPPSIVCPELSRTISNGRLLSDQSEYGEGDSVTYLCNLGHEMVGAATITCHSSGEWDNNPPQCVDATCPPPSTGTTVVSPSSEIGYLEYFTGTCNIQGLGETQLRSRCTYNVQAQSYQASITDLQCPLAVSCGQPTRLPGTDAYVLTSTGYGSTFTFRCRASYFRLEGQSSLLKNNEVTCMGDGRWDFGDLRCIAPSCVDPGTRPGVIQDATSYEEYSLVYYRCVRNGFEPTDKRPLLCYWDTTDNTLKWNGTAPDCVDVEPPTFSNCNNRDLVISKLTRPVANDPTALDNVKVTTFRITPSNHYMSQVLVADRSVTYLAQDAAGNTATCDIEIFIRDEEPPVLTCEEPFTVRLTTATATQSYTVNQLVRSQSDNSGSVTLTMTPSQVTFDRRSVDETYTVEIVASDPTGNTDLCLVQIKVEATPCVDWSVYVEHGQTSCSPTGNGYSCSVTCDPGYVLYENPAQSSVGLSCSNGGPWSRDRPVCVAQRVDVYRQSFQLRYLTGSSIPASCADTYTSQLNVQVPNMIQNLQELCSTTFPQAQVTPAAGEPLVSVQSDTVYGTFTMDISATGGSTSQNNNAVDQCAAYIRNAFVSVTTSIFSISRLSSEGACPGSAQANFQSNLQDGRGCGNNEETYSSSSGQQTCLSCPPGFSSRNGQSCAECTQGTYFSSEFAGCVACPDNARWVGSGARSEMDCYLSCPYGYTSSSGSAPCQICPKNTYSRDRTSCVACPQTLLTSDDGQALISSCRGICEAGYYSKDGLEPCTPCPRGFYQSSVQSTTCSECNSDYTTSNVASTSSSQCVVAEPLLCDQFKCLNGGTCRVAGHEYYCICREGYTGRNCDFYMSPCASQPCYNQAICTPTGTLTYTCECPTTQLTGDNCETNTNEICLNNPCQNFGGCKTGVANYMCLCPSYSMYSYGASGFGSECTTLRDPCLAYPCLNNAQCEVYGNIRRRCICQVGFTGESCETDIDSCLSNPCKNGAQCIDGPAGAVTCVCVNGFQGSFCEEVIDRCTVNTCPSFSICVDNYLTGDLVCVCQEGFVKEASGACIQVTNQVCSPNPCENGGICYPQGDSYACFCSQGYEGANCQHNADDCDPNPCQNGGICSDLDPPPPTGYRFTCQCNSDTYGNTCLDSVDICQASTNPCNAGHSRCIDLYRGYFCECDQGYFGQNCTDRSNPLCESFPCQHGGTCVETSSSSFECRCPDGYDGPACASVVDNCLGDPCQNGGACISYNQGYKCSCPYGFRGNLCETSYNLCSVANPCQNPGSTCSDVRGIVSCSCGAGYSGPYCQTKDEECSSSSCENGATCQETASGTSCICPIGYEGGRCETNTDDCVSNNCPSGSQCVDGLNSFTCVCLEDRVGDDCSKVVSPAFDVILTGNTAYQNSDYQRLVQPINQRAFTVSTWVRFTKRDTPGTILSLYGLRSDTDFSDPEEILRLDSTQIQLRFGNSRSLAYSKPVDDGFWHHLAVAWDSNQGAVNLYVDGQLASVAGSYHTLQTVRPFGWLILGGDYDSDAKSVDQSGGMTGRLSHTYISSRALGQSEVNTLATDKAAVPADPISGYTVAMATGAAAATDYDSELENSVCISSADCNSLDAIAAANPQFSSCPNDQVLVSDRVSTPTWNEPQVSSGQAGSSSGAEVKTTKLSGQTTMGWGVHGVTYANVDDDGNADVCSFRVFNRRSNCSEPSTTAGQTQICRTVNGFLRCTVSCSNNFRPSAASPTYYSCGVNGVFDAADRPLQFQYPSCSSCRTPPRDFTVHVNFTLSTSSPCGSNFQQVAQQDLVLNVRGALVSLRASWPDLCGRTDCSDVSITASCSSVHGVTVTFVLPARDEFLTKFDNSATTRVEEVVTSAIVDDGAFVFAGTASPVARSHVITSVYACPSGTVLIGDCCAECGLGHYYDTATNQCAACPKGTYLSTRGTTGIVANNQCQFCPSAQTTAQEGATSSSDCYQSCQLGTYFNLATSSCTDCPQGFYANQSGTFYCSACGYLEDTPGTSTTSSLSCSTNPVTTQAPVTQSPGIPNVGASTGDEDSSLLRTLLIVLAVLLFLIILIFIIIFCCFRTWAETICPCLVSKVTPEEKSQWHYVNRFGETNMKFVSYKMSEVQGRRSDKESLVSEDNHSVHTNISLQVPIFEEKLNGNVTKKSIHVAEHTPTPREVTEVTEVRPRKKRSRSKRRRRRENQRDTLDTEDETVAPRSLPALQTGSRPPLNTGEEVVVRRPPSAFNKPKPKLDQVPYNDFVPSPRIATPESSQPTSRINLDSDDDLR